MQRDIKLRVWYKEERRMSYPDLYILQSHNAPVINIRPNLAVANRPITTHLEAWGLFGNEPKSITMQYAGFQDINASDIYEHDVVRNTEGTYVVRFDTKMGWFGLYRRRAEKVGSNKEWEYVEILGMRVGGLVADKYQVQVVGNIYENPELFKEVK